jgi:hypothetical protein
MAMTDSTNGRALRDAQLEMFEIRDALFLEHCRVLARMLATEQGKVSINDIRARVKIPPGMHPSVLGAVFRIKQFQAVGYTEATHPEAHARVVRVYSLATNKE